jgi:hypothetical protein
MSIASPAAIGQAAAIGTSPTASFKAVTFKAVTFKSDLLDRNENCRAAARCPGGAEQLTSTLSRLNITSG